MPDNFVGREEFNNLRQEVQELKTEMNENKSLLQQIDKKCDIITERIANGDKIDELKLEPIKKRLDALEDKHKWLTRTVIASIIGIAIKIFFEVAQQVQM